MEEVNLEKISSVDVHAHLDELEDVPESLKETRVAGVLGITLTGKCPASPALQDGAKGHNIRGNYLTGKPRPLGRRASKLND